MNKPAIAIECTDIGSPHPTILISQGTHGESLGCYVDYNHGNYNASAAIELLINMEKAGLIDLFPSDTALDTFHMLKAHRQQETTAPKLVVLQYVDPTPEDANFTLWATCEGRTTERHFSSDNPRRPDIDVVDAYMDLMFVGAITIHADEKTRMKYPQLSYVLTEGGN